MGNYWTGHHILRVVMGAKVNELEHPENEQIRRHRLFVGSLASGSPLVV